MGRKELVVIFHKTSTFGPKRGSKQISSDLLMVTASETKHIEASPQKIGNIFCNFFAINTNPQVLLKCYCYYACAHTHL